MAAKIRLFESQRNYLNRLGNKPYMFVEPGGGKTLMAMTRAYERGYRKVIVIAPASLVKTKQWERELEKTDLEFEEFEVHSPYFLQKWRTHDLSKYHDWALILDEGHKYANSQSLQGQGAYQLSRIVADYVLLSGTPMSAWSGAVNYAKMTELVKHKTEFYKRFVIEQPSYAHKGKDIVGYRDVPVLVDWWNSIAERAYTKEFTELPSKQVIMVEIPVKRKAYTDMLRTKMTADGEPLDNAPKMNWALRAYAETAPEKLQWAIEKIEGLNNCIVFCNTTAAIDELSVRLTKAKINHGIWDGKRKHKFDDKDVMLVQYQAGGTGLNLQKFSNTIFLSPSYSYIDYSQAVARTHRTGQRNKCTFYQLTAVNTIDRDIWRALAEKKDFDDKLVNEETV